MTFDSPARKGFSIFQPDLDFIYIDNKYLVKCTNIITYWYHVFSVKEKIDNTVTEKSNVFLQIKEVNHHFPFPKLSIICMNRPLEIIF